MVIVSATDSELPVQTTTDELSTTTTSDDHLSNKRKTARLRANLRKNQPRRIRGSGNLPEDDNSRSLFVQDRDVDPSGRKDPPSESKDGYKIVNNVSWRERMFPPTISPTISPSESPSISPSMEVDNPGYYQELDRPLRIACGGDSLTRGRSGGTAAAHTYPTQLWNMLGSNFQVYNYGRNAAIARRGRSLSYARQPEFQNSLNLKPDIYLLMLGTNDSMYWGIQGQNFDDSLEWLVNKIQSISPESPPRIILAIPPWVKRDNFGIRSSILVNRINPEIQAVAKNQNVQLVNMYDVTYNQGNFYTSDDVHLNENGYRSLAAAWKVAIQCNDNGICEVGENCNTCPGDCFVNCS